VGWRRESGGISEMRGRKKSANEWNEMKGGMDGCSEMMLVSSWLGVEGGIVLVCFFFACALRMK
jgi:hypothetical protein